MRAYGCRGDSLVATCRAARARTQIMRIALREVTVLNGLSHCNIIKLRRAFRTPSGEAQAQLSCSGG